MKIHTITPIDIYHIEITFKDGTTGILDLTPTSEDSIFRELKKNDLRQSPHLTPDGGEIYRNDDIGIDSMACYIRITDHNPFIAK